MHDYEVIVVGCGLSGVVIAERFANLLNKKVLIVEKRDHVGGNVYDYVDPDTNILVSKYGAHLFHTNNDRVWEYVTRFCDWRRWDHKVIAYVDETYVPIPVNINTVNALCCKNLQSELEMNEWLSVNQVKYDNIVNSEEVAKSRVGEILYEKIFRNYTYKQWNKFPKELDPSVLARIPVRNNFDDRYFNDKYQALPEHGYTRFIERMLHSRNITYMLNTDFFDLCKEKPETTTNKIVIFTGRIDTYFNDAQLEKLEYRSIDFITEKFSNMNYYQPNSVVNYPSYNHHDESNSSITRIVEYKHFLHQKSADTIIVKEKPTDYEEGKNEPYYPVPTQRNIDLYEKYKALALAERKANVHFIGRLANYKYFNMDTAILNALEYFDEHFAINFDD